MPRPNFAERFFNMMTLNNDSDEYEDEYEEVEDLQEPEEEETIYEPEEAVEEKEEEKPEEKVPAFNSRTTSRSERKILNFQTNTSRENQEKKEPEVESPRRANPFQVRKGESEIVKVIKPQEFNEVKGIVDELKQGKTIVVNLEGLEVTQAQRIMDFVGGASYIVDGSLNAISNNIFIAAPDNIEVSGDLRSEIVNKTILSPELG